MAIRPGDAGYSTIVDLRDELSEVDRRLSLPDEYSLALRRRDLARAKVLRTRISNIERRANKPKPPPKSKPSRKKPSTVAMLKKRCAQIIAKYKRRK